MSTPFFPGFKHYSVDIDNSDHNVRFDHLVAHVPDVITQLTGLGYHMDVELVEA